MTNKPNTSRRFAVVMEGALVGFKFTLKQAATLGFRTEKNVDEALNDINRIVTKHTK